MREFRRNGAFDFTLFVKDKEKQTVCEADNKHGVRVCEQAESHVLPKKGVLLMAHITTANSKNPWVLLILVLAGVVLGGFLGSLAENVSFLQWLNYGQSFGLGINNPVVLNLGILVITFGLSIKITIAGIIGIIIAILIYRLL